VQDLIDLSRVQGDDPLAKAVPVELAEVVGAARERVAEVAEARSIEIVAAGADGVRVLGDLGQLTTAVGNLVENAVNYSPDHTKVAVSVRVEGELAEVSVTDQGVGIPDQDLNRIFERFYRVDPARSRVTGGTGLGLAIVKHIAATHGGDVSVWSVEGAGSTFTLRLPLSVQSAAAELDPTPRSPQTRITTGSRTT
jgi:two-component system, OmpR family, sensor histidine kinase SenX3